MSSDAKAKRLYESDMAKLGTITCSKLNLPMRWENAPQEAKNRYYDAVADGEYDIEFKEDNND